MSPRFSPVRFPPGAWAGVLLALLALLCAGGPARAATLYLAPTGSDAAPGTSPGTALATLGAALARAQMAAPGEETRVLILPGVYRGQTIAIDGRRLHGPLTLLGQQTAPAAPPTFVGSGVETWLRLRAAEGQDSGLTVKGLRIVHYATAITLNGNREDPAAFNRGTVLADLVLEQIGSDTLNGDGTDGPIRPSPIRPSTAAIRLVNARDTTIRGVTFRAIRNSPPQTCPGLHAIYLASHATGARIEGNTFADFCGSAIKLRDDSGGATITGNRFSGADGAPGIEEWFCDMDRTDECTKAAGECPSTGIVIGPNDFGAMPASLRIRVRGSRTQRPWCPPGSARAPRFILPGGKTLP